jgi:hypothetical protein
MVESCAYASSPADASNELQDRDLRGQPLTGGVTRAGRFNTQPGRGDGVDWPRLAESADGPDQDHPVLLDGPDDAPPAALAAQNRSVRGPIRSESVPEYQAKYRMGPNYQANKVGE